MNILRTFELKSNRKNCKTHKHPKKKKEDEEEKEGRRKEETDEKRRENGDIWELLMTKLTQTAY